MITRDECTNLIVRRRTRRRGVVLGVFLAVGLATASRAASTTTVTEVEAIRWVQSGDVEQQVAGLRAIREVGSTRAVSAVMSLLERLKPGTEDDERRLFLGTKALGVAGDHRCMGLLERIGKWKPEVTFMERGYDSGPRKTILFDFRLGAQDAIQEIKIREALWDLDEQLNRLPTQKRAAFLAEVAWGTWSFPSENAMWKAAAAMRRLEAQGSAGIDETMNRLSLQMPPGRLQAGLSWLERMWSSGYRDPQIPAFARKVVREARSESVVNYAEHLLLRFRQ